MRLEDDRQVVPLVEAHRHTLRPIRGPLVFGIDELQEPFDDIICGHYRVGYAALVDLPPVTRQYCLPLEDTFRTSFGHLCDVEVAAIGEVEPAAGFSGWDCAAVVVGRHEGQDVTIGVSDLIALAWWNV